MNFLYFPSRLIARISYLYRISALDARSVMEANNLFQAIYTEAI